MTSRFTTFAIAALAGIALPTAAQAQSIDEGQQRQAVEAWTQCIADENAEEAHALLVLDYRGAPYRRQLNDLADRRVSSACFNAMPRDYRRIELGGLPFAGGLAERLIETMGEDSLVLRLSRAVVGAEAETFSYTDEVANCMARGAPNLVADLFATEVGEAEETAALGALAPVLTVCSRSGSSIEASPMAMRAMLATASYRLLAAQVDEPSGNDDA